MLTIKAMVKKDGMRVDRNYNVNLLKACVPFGT